MMTAPRRCAQSSKAARRATEGMVDGRNDEGSRRVKITDLKCAVIGDTPIARIMTDALNRRVIPSHVKEASARGAALLALEALGEIGALEDVPAPLGEPLEPDPDAHAAYREARERQERLYAATVGKA